MPIKKKRLFTVGLVMVASAAFFIAQAHAQNIGDVANHALAVGKGQGKKGLSAVGPCTLGYPIVGNGASADPKCDGTVVINGGSITGLPSPSASSDAATKGYVDTVAVGLIIKAPSRLATTAALATNTYNNGASGVGATLTATANGALSIDSVAVATNDVVVVKNESTAANNGIYIVTQTGDSTHPYILTRATYFDQASEMLAGSYTLVSAGTVNSGIAYVLQAQVATVGTTAANFQQFNSPGVVSLGGQNGAVTCGDSVSCAGGAVASAFNNGATGAATISGSTKWKQIVNAQDFTGFDATGVSSSTTAVQNCLNSVSTTGGICVLPNNAKVYLATSVTLPDNTSISCGSNFAGNGASSTTANYNNVGGIRLLAGTATIILGNATAVNGCMIIPQSMSFPQSSSASWTGTAITVPVVTTGVQDITLINSLIMGFDTCYDSLGAGGGFANRVYMHHVNMDCNLGVRAGSSADSARYMAVHVWPFATFAACNAAGGGCTPSTYYGRSKQGFYLGGTIQAGTIVGEESLSYGHYINLDVQAPNSLIESFWADTPNSIPASGTTFNVRLGNGGTEADGTVIGSLYTAGAPYGPNPTIGLYVNGSSAVNIQASNLTLNGATASCLNVDAGAKLTVSNAVITNCWIGSSGPYIYVTNVNSGLSIAGGVIESGASGGSRTADVYLNTANIPISSVSLGKMISDLGGSNAKLIVAGNPIVYTTYTPSLSCASGSLTSASSAGIYYKVSDFVTWVRAQAAITTAGSCAGAVNIGLPGITVTGPAQVLPGNQSGVGGAMLQCIINAGSAFAGCSKYDNTTPAASGATLYYSGVISNQ